MIILPWPPKELWPNRKAHYMAKAKVAKKYKADAYLLAKSIKAMDTHLTVTFCPPRKMKFDLDNCLSATKFGIDGIAKAWGVDDSVFTYTLKRGEPIKQGEVRIA